MARRGAPFGRCISVPVVLCFARGGRFDVGIAWAVPGGVVRCRRCQPQRSAHAAGSNPVPTAPLPQSRSSQISKPNPNHRTTQTPRHPNHPNPRRHHPHGTSSLSAPPPPPSSGEGTSHAAPSRSWKNSGRSRRPSKVSSAPGRGVSAGRAGRGAGGRVFFWPSFAFGSGSCDGALRRGGFQAGRGCRGRPAQQAGRALKRGGCQQSRRQAGPAAGAPGPSRQQAAHRRAGRRCR